VILQVSDREDAPYEPCDRAGLLTTAEPSTAWGAVRVSQEARDSALLLSRTRRGCAEIVAALLEVGIPHVAERGPAILRPTSIVLRVADALTRWLARGRPAPRDAALAALDALDTRGPVLAGKRGAKKSLLEVIRDGEDRISVEVLADHGIDVRDLERRWADPDPAWWRLAILGSHLDAGALLLVRDWLLWYGEGDALLEVARRVVVTTAHASKGREADLVVLDARQAIRLASRDTPQNGANGGALDDFRARRDEDLRCLYVAITRARHRIILVRGHVPGRPDWLALHGL
jgi:hypothetical protein